MKVLGLILRGLTSETVVTTNSEKSAEVIVGGNTEAPNNLKAQAKCVNVNRKTLHSYNRKVVHRRNS